MSKTDEEADEVVREQVALGGDTISAHTHRSVRHSISALHNHDASAVVVLEEYLPTLLGHGHLVLFDTRMEVAF